MNRIEPRLSGSLHKGHQILGQNITKHFYKSAEKCNLTIFHCSATIITGSCSINESSDREERNCYFTTCIQGAPILSIISWDLPNKNGMDAIKNGIAETYAVIANRNVLSDMRNSVPFDADTSYAFGEKVLVFLENKNNRDGLFIVRNGEPGS